MQGEVAEWLGRGLQNLLQRFESALRLKLLSVEHKVLFRSHPSQRKNHI